MPDEVLDDNEIDAHVDVEILSFLDLDKPRSFFLFAGAGSGKTGSLVRAVGAIMEKYERRLLLNNQQVAIITYTNNAANEIKSRLNFNPLVHVSTIHSFCWQLIGGFNNEIRDWLRGKLLEDIEQLKADLAKGRAGTKIAVTRARSLEAKSERLASLDEIKVFSYDPDGENATKDSLNHSEVIGITSTFLNTRQGLQLILIDRHPILLIDESQDTNRALMESFITLQQNWKDQFCLGLFGDVMQRIYADGKADLVEAVPADWAKPKKVMNHRCPKRVVTLINQIRADVDGQAQRPRSDKPEGIVRLFIVPEGVDKRGAEEYIRTQMAAITKDNGWSDASGVKCLVLEHHMAASRLGFSNLFSSLYAADRLRTGLLKGNLPGLKLFGDEVLSLHVRLAAGDSFGAMATLKAHSPLLTAKALQAALPDQQALLKKVKEAANSVHATWDGGHTPTFGEVLKPILESGVFTVADDLRVAGSVDLDEAESDEEDDGEADGAVQLAWNKFLSVSFDEIIPFSTYAASKAIFDTHQGVKGLEFPRVMVVMDDEEARGFLFSYEGLFGAKPPPKAAPAEGKETSFDRTRRLFYVTCSRAEEGVALVAYSKNPAAVKQSAIEYKWFSEAEIEVLALAS